MIGGLWRLARVLWVMLATAVLVATVIGSQNPVPAALRGFSIGCDGIRQPCWYGIVPETTRITDAQFSLQANQYGLENIVITARGQRYFYRRTDSAQTCRVVLHAAGTQVESLWLERCADTRLGDLMVMVGFPDDVGTGATSEGGGIMLRFAGGSIRTYPTPFWSSPQVDLGTVFISRRTQEKSPGPRWRGFVPQWRYCALYRSALMCPLAP